MAKHQDKASDNEKRNEYEVCRMCVVSPWKSNQDRDQVSKELIFERPMKTSKRRYDMNYLFG